MSTEAAENYRAPRLSTLDLRGTHHTYAELRSLMPRQNSEYVGNAQQAVDEIIASVRGRGADYVKELSQRFDGVEQGALRVPPEAMKDAVDSISPELKAALEVSIERNRAFAAAQKPGETSIEVAPGAHLINRWTPVRRVGVYVPGGLAVYPSSVIMNTVPAQAAGVE
ncbi:histidinol dehydrogenase, partial [Rothia sp. ND6WE1A]|uniref:histidinol dehydrogenase n=1 Tax=Rothia sp. ND6WE1A TaxID=1848190 RepID=UPI000AC130C5